MTNSRSLKVQTIGSYARVVAWLNSGAGLADVRTAAAAIGVASGPELRSRLIAVLREEWRTERVGPIVRVDAVRAAAQRRTCPFTPARRRAAH